MKIVVIKIKNGSDRMKKKIIISLLIIISILILNISFTYAIDYNDYVPSDPSGYTNLTTKAGTILGIVRSIGVAVAVVALTIMGFKYMLGSVEEKADYKKSMVPLVIGIVLLAGGTVLVELIYKVAIQF